MKSIILITMVALALAGPAVPKEPETEQVAAGSLDGQEKAISEATLRLIALNQQMQKLQANSGLTRAATGQRASNNPLASIPILGQLIDLLLSILNGSLLNTGGDTDVKLVGPLVTCSWLDKRPPEMKMVNSKPSPTPLLAYLPFRNP
ncbi:hypothetical protein HDE_09832 [Halotydeus destructor]|nr:hypothetical protein HDE_09832 [Halotydeus destructor]